MPTCATVSFCSISFSSSYTLIICEPRFSSDGRRSCLCQQLLCSHLSCRRVLITSEVIPTSTGLHCATRPFLMLELFQRCIGTLCFCLLRAWLKHFLPKSTWCALVFVHDLHRERCESTCPCTLTAKEPLHVHCSGTRDTLLHFFFCDLFLDSLHFHLGAFTVSLFDGLFPVCLCLASSASLATTFFHCGLVFLHPHHALFGNSPLSSRVSYPSKSTDLSLPSSRRLKNFPSLSLFSSRDLFLFSSSFNCFHIVLELVPNSSTSIIFVIRSCSLTFLDSGQHLLASVWPNRHRE